VTPTFTALSFDRDRLCLSTIHFVTKHHKETLNLAFISLMHQIFPRISLARNQMLFTRNKNQLIMILLLLVLRKRIFILEVSTSSHKSSWRIN
jgi:hypothetical protein